MRIPVRFFRIGRMQRVRAAGTRIGGPVCAAHASCVIPIPQFLASFLRSRSAESSRHVLDNCPGSNPIDTPIPTKDWSRRFDTPIALPDGRVLRTLLDAGRYIHGLSEATYQRSEWLLAMKTLLDAAEGSGPLMFAEVAIRRAVLAGKPPPSKAPRRKVAKKYRVIR